MRIVPKELPARIPTTSQRVATWRTILLANSAQSSLRNRLSLNNQFRSAIPRFAFLRESSNFRSEEMLSFDLAFSGRSNI